MWQSLLVQALVNLTVTDKTLSGMGAATLSADLPGSNLVNLEQH